MFKLETRRLDYGKEELHISADYGKEYIHLPKLYGKVKVKLFVILIICKHAHDSTMYSLINGLQCDFQGVADIKHCYNSKIIQIYFGQLKLK